MRLQLVLHGKSFCMHTMVIPVHVNSSAMCTVEPAKREGYWLAYICCFSWFGSKLTLKHFLPQCFRWTQNLPRLCSCSGKLMFVSFLLPIPVSSLIQEHQFPWAAVRASGYGVGLPRIQKGLHQSLALESAKIHQTWDVWNKTIWAQWTRLFNETICSEKVLIASNAVSLESLVTFAPDLACDMTTSLRTGTIFFP